MAVIKPLIDEILDYEVRDILTKVYVMCAIIILYMQVQNANDDNNLREVTMEHADALIESGLTMPLSLVTVDDKTVIIEIVSLHHVLLCSKAELDQFLTGLSALGVLNAVRANPHLFEPYFCIGHSIPLVAGNL